MKPQRDGRVRAWLGDNDMDKKQTPTTDTEEQRQHDLYEKWRECGWPAFAVDFDFARRMESALREILDEANMTWDATKPLADMAKICRIAENALMSPNDKLTDAAT